MGILGRDWVMNGWGERSPSTQGETSPILDTLNTCKSPLNRQPPDPILKAPLSAQCQDFQKIITCMPYK